MFISLSDKNLEIFLESLSIQKGTTHANLSGVSHFFNLMSSDIFHK
jgi:hypothetical protein